MKKRILNSISKNLNNNRGSGLITVLYIMIVVVVFVTSLGSMFSNNLRQAVAQEKNMEAYYLSLSGIDIAMSALLQKDAKAETLLDLKFKENSITKSDTISVDNGELFIEISSYDISDIRWIKIISTGRLKNNKGSNTNTLEFKADNIKTQIWNKQ